MRNKENRKCPKCKDTYNKYPALSRVDNKTEICPLCGETEALTLVTAGYRKIKMATNGLTEIERKIRESIIQLHSRMESYIEEDKSKKRSERIKAGIKNKKMEEQRNEEMPKM